jgi:2-hydroxychromene-2-carboxylate isomerase
MPLKVEFLFDFGSPNAYLAELALPGIERRTGVKFAQFEGVFEPYFRAAYLHMWEEPKKMDDLETFRKAFISSGIDIDRLIARAQQDDVKKGLIDRTTDAVNRGAFGSPTFFVGKEMFFGKDQLHDVEASIVEPTSQPVSKTA